MHKILHLHNFICSNVVDFKLSKIILMMQTKVKMSLMRNHMAISLLVFLGRSSIDIDIDKKANRIIDIESIRKYWYWAALVYNKDCWAIILPFPHLLWRLFFTTQSNVFWLPGVDVQIPGSCKATWPGPCSCT